MTTTPTDPTTDDLTEWVERTLEWYGLSRDTFRYGPDGRSVNAARALLTSGPLADRLNALTRVEAVAARYQRSHTVVGQGVADMIRAAVRGDR